MHDTRTTEIEVWKSQMRDAELGVFLATLPSMMWFNPVWAGIFVVTLSGVFPVFGAVEPWRLAVVMGLQIANSVIGFLVHRHYQGATRLSGRAFEHFAVMQFLVGLIWGALPWLLWSESNGLNNILVFAMMAMVLLAFAGGRAMDMTIYALSVLPAFALGAIRFFTADSADGIPLAILLTVIFLFTVTIAQGSRLRFGEMLRNRLSNEMLNSQLRVARDEALQKRFEAETANASKTTFLANMSHELRTPLNAILGFSDIIANETFGPVGTPRYKEYATDIFDSGTHLLSIINDILDVAKIEAGRMDVEPAHIDARATIEKALALVMPRAAQNRQALTFDVEANAALYADPRAVQQIVMNLTSNAVKFTPDGGRIAVTGGAGEDGGFLLCVSDNGPGIAPALLDRVFKPFNQIDNRYNRQAGGTGLGLSLVRGLAELHGGRAWIDSEVGAGVKAYVYFPPSQVQRLPAKKRAALR